MSFSPFTNILVIIPSAPTTIGITTNFMFYIFLSFLARSRLLSLLLFSLESFSRKHLLIVFHWSLSDSRSPQLFLTLLSILVDLNNVLVWMDSTHPLISNSLSLPTHPFVSVPRGPYTIVIIVIFQFHRFFSSQAMCRI